MRAPTRALATHGRPFDAPRRPVGAQITVEPAPGFFGDRRRGEAQVLLVGIRERQVRAAQAHVIAAATVLYVLVGMSLAEVRRVFRMLLDFIVSGGFRRNEPSPQKQQGHGEQQEGQHAKHVTLELDHRARPVKVPRRTWRRKSPKRIIR